MPMPACLYHRMEGGLATAHSQTAETFGRRARRSAVFLCHSDPSGAGVRIIDQSRCRTDEGQRLHDVTDSSWTRQLTRWSRCLNN